MKSLASLRPSPRQESPGPREFKAASPARNAAEKRRRSWLALGSSLLLLSCSVYLLSIGLRPQDQPLDVSASGASSGAGAARDSACEQTLPGAAAAPCSGSPSTRSARPQRKSRRFKALADIVLIVNYNHPTDAFKSLPLWREVYSRVFHDVVFVSTDAIPELGVETAVGSMCNLTLMRCVRESTGSSQVPVPLGFFDTSEAPVMRQSKRQLLAANPAAALGRGGRRLSDSSARSEAGKRRKLSQKTDPSALRTDGVKVGRKLSTKGSGMRKLEVSEDSARQVPEPSEAHAAESTSKPQSMEVAEEDDGPEDAPQATDGSRISWVGGCKGTACACSDAERLFWSAVDACRKQQGTQQQGPICSNSGYFVYASLLSILLRYPNAAGFLWSNDDLILNYWNLESSNKSRLWFPHPKHANATMGSSPTNNLSPLWVPVPYGAKPTKQDVGRWELKRPIIQRARKALESLPEQYQEQYRASMLPLTDVVLKEVADVYYIPQRLVPDVLQLVPQFLAARVRSEMAIPMMFCALDNPSNFDDSALQDMVYIPPAKVLAKTHEVPPPYSTNLSAFHPWKMKEPAEAARIMHSMVRGDLDLRHVMLLRSFRGHRLCYFSNSTSFKL